MAKPEKTSVPKEIVKWIMRILAGLTVAMESLRSALTSALSVVRRNLVRAFGWLSAKRGEAKHSKFNQTDLEVSLVLLIFIAGVALMLTGIQPNFYWAVICWVAILVLVFRIIWTWEGMRGLTNLHKLLVMLAITGALVSFILKPMTKTYYTTVKKSFAFVAPSQGLVECERRSFFVKHSGVKSLPNAEMTLWDNNANRGSVAKYAEIAPGAPDPAAPKYVWWKPARPWDEDYTVTVISGDVRSDQRLIARSVAGKLRFASEVSMNGQPVLRCRDPLLPPSYTLAAGAPESCDAYMSVPNEITEKMEPEISQWPNGSINIPKAKIKTLSVPSGGVEGQREERNLWEYQKKWLFSDLSKYRFTRVLLLASDTGIETWKYAEELRDALHGPGWNVEGPRKLSEYYDGLLDVQVSTGKAGAPVAQALTDALTRAGIKHHTRVTADPDIEPGTIVVFVGSRSPDGVNPDMCNSAPFKPGNADSRPCASVAQVPNFCPFVKP